MFREITRFGQALPREECIRLLKEEKRGVLAVQGDDCYPYCLPINQYYDEETGNIYFHSGKEGHKMDAIKKCDKASFCVYDKGFLKPGEWPLNIKSVIVFGRIRVVEDKERTAELARKLCYKFIDDEEYIENQIDMLIDITALIELIPEHITGKLVNES